MHKSYLQLLQTIDALSKEKERLNIAIDGCSGAGKSRLAGIIASYCDCNIIHMDHFFLTPELRTEARLKETCGNVDYERFSLEVADGLAGGREFSYRRYDCRKMAFAETIHVKPRKINIVEGVYSMHPKLIDLYDFKVFLKVGEREQMRRILEREGKDKLELYLSLWIPLENKYFKETGLESKCDIVISTDCINE